ncbi:hypothetical protein ACQUJO_23930 [Ralstonia pseudosolanacearum]
MAFHITMEKIAENTLTADYRFKVSDGRSGVFQIDKESGEIALLEEMPGDEGRHLFTRAAVKIMRSWKQGNLPSVAEWAS